MAEKESLSLSWKLIKLGESLKLNVQKNKNKDKDGTNPNFLDLLYPAMNRTGVTLDIIKEEGIAQNRQSAYAALLTIRWTNADDRSDTLEVKLYAYGTHEDPQKARAKAWADCLYNYLWFKFGIWIGYGVPDTASPDGNAPNNPENKPTASQTAQVGINTHQQTGNNGSGQGKGIVGLSNAQLQRMYRKATAAGLTQGKVDEDIYHRYQLKDPREMNREQYDAICSTLDAIARIGGANNA